MRGELVAARSDFDRATAVSARPDEPSVYEAELDGRWQYGAGINGGTLLATAGRALAEELGRVAGHRDPFAISAYYTSAAQSGLATVRVTPVRHGRTMSTARATLSQTRPDGVEVDRFHALATYGDLGALDEEVRTTAAPPVLPPPDECERAGEVFPDFYLQAVPITDRVDLRLDPSTTGWTVGKPSGVGVSRGWLRMPDGREPDPLLLLMAVDLLPPVPFELGVLAPVPTVELTVHVRARPAAGWLRVIHSTRNYAGGYLDEDAEVWDADDRLVAQSRQLALIHRLPG